MTTLWPLGDHLVWWPLGDYLVTTWLLLGDYLVTTGLQFWTSEGPPWHLVRYSFGKERAPLAPSLLQFWTREGPPWHNGTTDSVYKGYDLHHFSDWNQFKIILDGKDDPSYRLMITLGPLCLWQCYSIRLYWMVSHGVWLYLIVLHGAAEYFIVLHGIILYSILLHDITGYFKVLY